MTAADTLRALLDAEEDQEMRAYYEMCLRQLALAPLRLPSPNPPRRCPYGPLDVLEGVER